MNLESSFIIINVLKQAYMESANPFASLKKQIEVNGQIYSYFSLPDLGDERIKTLPYSIRVLLESAVRNCDDFNVKSKDIYFVTWLRG